jgi:DNA-binding response OmpR family regulator
MHLLLVEDDERLARSLTRLLEEDRHVVEHAPDGRTGSSSRRRSTACDAVILDIGLPDMSGPRRRAPHLRKDGVDVSILMLTARDTVNDRVLGLDAGADDYVVKPFAYQEVAARLRALARRAEPGPRRAEPVLTAGAISLDEAARRVTVERPQRRPQPARVLAARSAPAPRRPDADPGPAPRPRVAVQRRRDAQRRGCVRPLPADEARRRRHAGGDRPGVGYRLADG